MAENKYIVSKDGTGNFDNLANALSVVSDGDEIIVRSGIYNESIEINKDVKIIGEAGDNSEMPVISIESGVVCTVSSDAKISNIRFENSNSVEVDSGSRGLHSLVEVTSNAVFTDCEFYGSFDGNIKIIGNDIAPEFYNCNIYGAKRNGVFILSGAKALFKKCKIHDNGFHGISIVNSNPHIEDCKIYNIKGYCIIFIGSNDATPEEIPNPEVINCEIYDSKDFEESLRGLELSMGGSRIRQCLHGGILINNAKGYVKNCYLHDIKGKGIEIGNSEPIFEDCEVFNLHFEGGKISGVNLSESGNGQFKNCSIHDVNGCGVIVSSGSNPSFDGCEIYNCTRSYDADAVNMFDKLKQEYKDFCEGINIKDNSTGSYKNCNIYHIEGCGILVSDDAEPVVENCIIHDCGHEDEVPSCGIFSKDNTKGKYTGCEIFDVRGFGISANDESDIVIENCELYDITDIRTDSAAGIVLYRNSNCLIKNCEIYCFHGDGIEFQHESHGIVDGCEIYGMRGAEQYGFARGISFFTNSSGEVKNCRIHDFESKSSVGILVVESENIKVSDCTIYDIRGDKDMKPNGGISIAENGTCSCSGCVIFNIEGNGIESLWNYEPEVENCKMYDISGNNTEFNVFENDNSDEDDADQIDDEDDEEDDEEFDEDIDYFDIQNGILVKYTGDGEKVRVPEGVTEIGNNAFCDLKNLKYVELPDTVMKLGNNAFSGSSIESIQLSENLTEIGDGCFSYTSISELELPDCLKKIGEKVFEFCNFDEFHIPKSLIDLSAFSFFNCKIDNISVDENNEKFTVIDGNLLSKDETIFYYHSNYKSYCEIPETIVEIDDFAFATTDIESIKFPDGIENIGSGAFFECHELKSVVIPDSVKVINKITFKSCDSLEEVILPKSLEEIKASAFCLSKLSEIELPESLVTIGTSAFQSCKISSVYIPKNVKEICGDSFCYCDNLECVNLDVNNENLTLEDNIIYTKDKKKLLYILPMADVSEFFVPEGVQIIGESVFCHNSDLQKVVMPDTVTEIEQYAFYDCKNLESITLSKNLKIISDNAFKGDEKLADLTIPESVTKIGDGAFSDCVSLKELSISDNVTEIGKGAFNIDSNNIIIHGNEDSYIAEYAKKNALKFDTVIKGLSIKHDKLVSYEGNKEYFVVPNNITCIGRKAFTGCSCLKEINIHDRVTKIDANAFKGCTDITITGYPGSPAAEYAAKYHLKFNPINITEKPVYMDESTVGSAGASGDYVLFGEWPQSEKSNSVTVDTAKAYNINGWNAYKGSDNCFYIYQKEKYSETCHYFKIEPIKWRLLDNNYDGEGGRLLLCDSVLYACTYYLGFDSREINGNTVEPSNYEYSEIRASLNGLDGSDYGVTNYNGQGFIDKAFSSNARKIIKTTTVSNNGLSLDYLESEDGLEYTCNDTKDKVFLLSTAEVVRNTYGFGPRQEHYEGSPRQRFATAFAEIDGVSRPCDWWTRSPSTAENVMACFVHSDGEIWKGFALHPENAVVPALVISDNNTKN